ncbi:MAG: cytochrome c biogenesis protein CcsA [Akkermansiaceae bacterium]|nr:cytochrome c biogenesis protein CcsA [Armatimonadota bacterium]
MNSTIALGGTALLYLIAAVLLGAALLLRKSGWLWTGRIAAALGAVLHMVAIGLRCVELKQAPFTTPAESLSLLAWIVALAYLLVELVWRLSATGAFALGAAFLLVTLGGLLSGSGQIGESGAALLNERAISLHILATVGATAAFVLAFCCAALYLASHRILKSKHGLTWIKRLPPLATVEQASFALVAVGFPLLTLGIVSGWLRAAAGNGLPGGWQWDPKTLLAYAVWFVYATYLWARLKAGWTPARTGYILLVGLILSLILFLVPSATHRFS